MRALEFIRLAYNMIKPMVAPSQACHRRALIERQKENRRRRYKLSKARKRIIALVAAVLDAILLYIGGSLLYWGRIWYLHPLTRGLIIVAPQMMIYGALAVVAGIFVAWKIKSFLWPPKKAPKKSPPPKDNAGNISVGITR